MRLEVAMHGFSERTRSVEIEAGWSYTELLGALEIPLESVLVTAGGEVVPADAGIDPVRPVRIVRIVSGG